MYTLRFPFRLPVDRDIGEGEVSVDVDGLAYSITFSKPYWVIKVQGLGSEEEARNHIHRIWAGLTWLMLNRDVSPNFMLETQKVYYPDDPQIATENLSRSFGGSLSGPVNGLIDGSQPAVYPTEKLIRVLTLGDVTVKLTTPSSTVLASLAEGAAFRRSDQLFCDHRLRIALELYGAHFTESSSKARFLTLIMALEALATSCSRTQLVLDLMDQWRSQVEGLLHNGDMSREDSESLQALSRELLFRKQDSLRRRIYNLVWSTLEQAGDKEAERLAAAVKRLYDLRSKLVHEGKLPENLLSDSLAEAKQLVQRVLRAKYMSSVL